jgi:RNA polymerase sigma-70 factor, ECF subfamily
MGMERETSWVLRAQSGDREALDALLRSVQEPLFHYLLRLTGRRATAEDALQETLLRVCRKLRWLDEPSLFRAWTFRIASREAFRLLGREGKRGEVPAEAVDSEPAASPAPPPRFAREELAALVAAASPASRAVLLLHYGEDMPLADVAAVLDISIGTAKSRLSYGLARLRVAIGKEQA